MKDNQQDPEQALRSVLKRLAKLENEDHQEHVCPHNARTECKGCEYEQVRGAGLIDRCWEEFCAEHGFRLKETS